MDEDDGIGTEAARVCVSLPLHEPKQKQGREGGGHHATPQARGGNKEIRRTCRPGVDNRGMWTSGARCWRLWSVPLRLDIMFLQLSAVSILNFAFWPLCLTILLSFLLKATNAPAALIAVPSLFVCVLPYCVYIVPIITADT